MKAIIVAGGRGERLKPLTNNIPKPMVEIRGKPLLEHILNLLKKNGVKDFIFALCYLPELIVEYFGDGTKLGVKIAYTFEDPNLPFGTAGSILPAKNLISDTFIVTYADIIRDLEIKEMILFHKSSESLTTINVYKHTGNNFKSQIKFNKNNLLSSFQEFKAGRKPGKEVNWSNGSFYIFEKEIFKYIPSNKKSDFGKDIFPKLIKANKKVKIFPSLGYFLDIGTKESLQKIQQDLKINPSILDG